MKLPETTEIFTVPELRYTDCDTIPYRSDECDIKYSPVLAKTGKNYYDSLKLLTGNVEMTSAAEELAMQFAVEKSGKHPRDSPIFADLFGKGNQRYVWQWTTTGLRVPEGQKPEQFDTFDNKKYWTRIVLLGDKELTEFLVPEGYGRVVTSWNELFGIPAETDDIPYPHEPYTTHFYFDPEPIFDKISQNFDVAIGRSSDWHDDGDWCLNVFAYCGRWDAGSVGGFRPVVRGSTQKIETIDERIGSNVESDAWKRDYLSMTPKDFQKKYRI